MANLLSTLYNSSNALSAYDRVLEVTQTNVANASTPGYAKQSLRMEALPFDPSLGLTGGVTTGQMESARNEYAERAVRRQSSGLGRQQQAASSLTDLQSIFDISGNTGIPAALNKFYQAVSSWGQTPGSTPARQAVIDRASDVAQTFQSAATQLVTLANDTATQINDTVTQVNKLVGQIGVYNRTILETGSATRDMGMDAQVHATLEDLSRLVDFTSTQQADGTTTILLGGSAPLLIGDHQYALRADLLTPDDPPPVNANAPGAVRLLTPDGTDVTARVADGQLRALLDMRNTILPSYTGDSYQAGSLNQMAKQFADRVNDVLTSGYSSDGPPPVAGVPLFVYDAANATNMARTTAVDPNVTPDQLPAIDPGPPYVSNGIPLALSQLALPSDDADRINGVSYSEFYGQMAANAGSSLQSAKNGVQVQQSLLAQAQNQRSQLSGVSLDEEALTLVEFQRAYQANSRVITVLNDLTQEVINILR
ncbi:MAG: flagellar hook-associated protein FlgK [Acidobacteriia bacterium]|nr:flagellar hook-associated protein FlgK [Terriglobia bacterium]